MILHRHIVHTPILTDNPGLKYLKGYTYKGRYLYKLVIFYILYTN